MTTGTTTFEAGTLLAQGRYRIDRVLGEGGMGTVYAATELALERPVALKVLLPELSQHATARQRMEAEAKALARIRSPHVVGVNTVFDEDGLLVIDLEYMAGGSLADRLSGEGVDEATARRWMDQILQGLESLHATGLVHRDLKPANVLLDEQGTLKVTDLGIAQDRQRTTGFKTKHDANLGTPEYMSPEQVQSAATVDARADIYAAGVMLYEFMTGRVPFEGSEFDVKAGHVQRAPDMAPVQAKNPGLVAVIERALAKDPEARFATATAFRKALTQPEGAAAVAPVAAPPAGRPPWVAIAAVAVAVVLVGGAVAGYLIWGSGGTARVDVAAGAAKAVGESSESATEATIGAAEAKAFPTLREADEARGQGNDSKARNAYDAACTAGSHRACLELAFLQFEGRAGPAEKEAAHSRALPHVAAVDAACQKGDSAACVALGLVAHEGIGLAKDQTRAVELYRKACDGGYLRGCSNLGYMYENGHGVAKDEARAVELYRKACDGGVVRSCYYLGYMYDSGDGVAKDEARAVELYRKACDGGDMRGCTNLGYMYESGHGVAKDEARAGELYRKACDGGDMGGCRNLGVVYAYGKGVAKDEARAVELYRKACDGGQLLGCTSLGYMYESGHGVAKDSAHAVEAYRKACDGGYMAGCGFLGVMYANGNGLAKDDSRACELFDKGCEGGHMHSCRNLGVCYEYGTYVAKDAARAVELYRKACDGGDMSSCGDLGTMYANGKGVAKDKSRAKELFGKACDGGVTEACRRL